MNACHRQRHQTTAEYATPTTSRIKRDLKYRIRPPVKSLTLIFNTTLYSSRNTYCLLKFSDACDVFSASHSSLTHGHPPAHSTVIGRLRTCRPCCVCRSARRDAPPPHRSARLNTQHPVSMLKKMQPRTPWQQFGAPKAGLRLNQCTWFVPVGPAGRMNQPHLLPTCDCSAGQPGRLSPVTSRLPEVPAVAVSGERKPVYFVRLLPINTAAGRCITTC